jgi:hypothetical protein
MKSTIAHQLTSDKQFLQDLKSDTRMGRYPDNPEKQKISLRIEREFREGFLYAATDAASLDINPINPYNDIYEQLGLYGALREHNIIRTNVTSKRLKQFGIPSDALDDYIFIDDFPAEIKEAIVRAMEMAYLRGVIYALSAIDRSLHHWSLSDVFWDQWPQFHETLVKPWAEEVKVWAADPIEPEAGNPYDCPPDLIHMAFKRAANLRAIKLSNSTI